MTIRRARPEDAADIAAIARESPEASQWDPTGYDVSVAEIHDEVAGFLVTRAVAEQEIEILNVAVARARRRCGVARALVRTVLSGAVFLEVRKSNTAARKLYESLGFMEIAERPNYYENPTESAVVMKFHSC